MKHNFNELDQFFDAARNTTPVMDDDAFASIVADANVPTEIMRQSPTSRIMSAFKHQGGMTMSGLGLTGFAGILATTYYLNAGNSVEQKQHTSLRAEVATTEEVAKPMAKFAPRPVTASVVPYTFIDPNAKYTIKDARIIEPQDHNDFRTSLPADSLWASMRVEQIKPIEVSQDEIDKLGINEAGEGKVFVIHQLNDGGVTMKMSFPPTGMDAAYDLTVGNGAKIDKTIIAQIMPTMVTDAKGKKLAFFFKSQMQDDNVSINTASYEQHDGFDGDDNGNEPRVRMNVNVVETNDDVVDIDDDAPYDLEVNGDKQVVKLHHPGLPQGMKFDLSAMALKDSTMPRRFSAHVIASDSAQSDKLNLTFDFNFDSSNLAFNANAMRERMQSMENHAMQLRMNVDSIRSSVMTQLKDINIDSIRQKTVIIKKLIERNVTVDSLLNRLDVQQIPQLMKLRDMDHSKIKVKMLDEPHMKLKEFNLPMVRIQVEKINNLVPVQIKAIDPSVKYNQNGLIFWYDTDKKFAENAPQSLQEKINKTKGMTDNSGDVQHAAVKKASIINEPMVYPNPALGGRTIFKYSLAEPRAVSIAVHDLLGKQVMKVSDLEPKTAGTFEKELDLSSLEAGVYLVIMVTDQGEQITQRVVLEK